MSVEGVEEAEVSLAGKSARVVVRRGTSSDAIVEAIQASGPYRAERLPEPIEND
ncbi:MAG TPA: hypothetical protein ENI85_13845 [Deltaproteobacteria bacterium]|nr:hypothetical protein [Deltaproteobacteria bacterium]